MSSTKKTAYSAGSGPSSRVSCPQFWIHEADVDMHVKAAACQRAPRSRNRHGDIRPLEKREIVVSAPIYNLYRGNYIIRSQRVAVTPLIHNNIYIYVLYPFVVWQTTLRWPLERVRTIVLTKTTTATSTLRSLIFPRRRKLAGGNIARITLLLR